MQALIQRDRKLAQLETAKAMFDRAKRRQDESDRREAGAAEEIRVDPKQMEPLKSMIPSLVVEVARLKAEIADSKAKSEIEMALPRIAATSAQSDLIFIITGGRIYIVPGKIFIDITQDLCTRFRSFDDRCVDIAKCEVECGGLNLIQTIVLNLGSGVDLKDPLWSDSPQWKEWWSWVGPAPVVASLIVDPDSFREFATVRRFMSSAGKRYDVDPKMYSGSYKRYGAAAHRLVSNLKSSSDFEIFTATFFRQFYRQIFATHLLSHCQLSQHLRGMSNCAFSLSLQCRLGEIRCQK